MRGGFWDETPGLAFSTGLWRPPAAMVPQSNYVMLFRERGSNFNKRKRGANEAGYVL